MGQSLHQSPDVGTASGVATATTYSHKHCLNAWVVAATAALYKNPIAVMVPAHQVQTGSSIPVVTATNVTSAAAVSAAETARAAALAGEGGRAGMDDAAFPFSGSGRPAMVRGKAAGGTSPSLMRERESQRLSVCVLGWGGGVLV